MAETQHNRSGRGPRNQFTLRQSSSSSAIADFASFLGPIDGDGVEIVAAYSRDHDRSIGAGVLTAKLGATPIVLHQITSMQAALHRRLRANALHWLART
jgi:hypothetical protein